MVENKRFKLKYINEQHISANLYDNKTFIGAIGIGEELIVELLNGLSEENEKLKQSYIQLKHRHSLLHDVCLDAECDRDGYHKDVLSLEKENEQLKSEIEKLSYANEDLLEEKRIWKQMSDEYTKLSDENEQLKKVLGSILLEVKRDISNTNQTGEIKVFINPNSFDLISEVLRKYGALKEWYE